MSRNLAILVTAFGLSAGTGHAEAPSVAVDIVPLHSLVSQVMVGVGEPNLIVSQGASPHSYALRPSQAKALQDAQVLFWLGEDLTPWLAGAAETVAAAAKSVEFLEHASTQTLEFREDALFVDEDHNEGHEDGHDHGHEHDDHDPHAWLSPENASAWLEVIAAELSQIDPDHAETYRANADAAQVDLVDMRADIQAILAPARGKKFIVFHDAYQYFEASFDFPAVGAISLSDASDPSPARIAEIQARVADQGASCVLSEPQFNPAMVKTVLDGTSASTAILDPLGSDLEIGPNLYAQMLRNLAKSLADCL